MDTVEVKILRPEAIIQLDDMAREELIEVSDYPGNADEKKPLQFGCMKGLVLYMADDFDAPLDDFAEYM